MNARRDSFEGLNDLRRVLDDGTEMLAVLVSFAVSQEVPPARLIEAAGEALERLASWRAVILKLQKHSEGSSIRSVRKTLQ